MQMRKIYFYMMNTSYWRGSLSFYPVFGPPHTHTGKNISPVIPFEELKSRQHSDVVRSPCGSAKGVAAGFIWDKGSPPILAIDSKVLESHCGFTVQTTKIEYRRDFSKWARVYSSRNINTIIKWLTRFSLLVFISLIQSVKVLTILLIMSHLEKKIKPHLIKP